MYNNTVTSSVSVEKPSPINKEMEQQEVAIRNLHEYSLKLQDKLQIVLSEPRPQPTEADESPVPTVSQLATSIRSNNAELFSIVARLNDILERLEL